MSVTTVPVETGEAVTIQYPVSQASRVWVAIGWEAVPYTPCIESPTTIKNRRMEDLLVDGIPVSACFQDHYQASDPEAYLYTTIDFELKRQDKERILLEAGYTGDRITSSGLAARALTDRILSSIRIY